MKIYCLSGLGVDERAFQNIKAEGVELVPVPWIDPLPKETLEQYARRLFEKTNPEDGYNLLGVSFGGMIAIEFAKIKQPGNLFLVSTIYRTSQLPWFLKIGSALRLHKFMPTGMMRRGNFVTNYLFGTGSKEDKQLLDQILRDTDPTFLRWAIGAIANWKNRDKPTGIFIHGSNDKMLPLKHEAEYVLKGGGHFMIVDKAEEISRILEKG